MDFEDFLSAIYTPLIGIDTVTDTIRQKCNEDWSFLKNNHFRKEVEELLSLVFAIRLYSKYILEKRENYIKEFYSN